jgi:hypothetical protein
MPVGCVRDSLVTQVLVQRRWARLRTNIVAAPTAYHRRGPRPEFGSSVVSCRHSVSSETVPLAAIAALYTNSEQICQW